MPIAQDLREAIRMARTRECLIPPNDVDGNCSNELNNCHLIGIGHLRPIAENGYVFEWDVTDIPNMVESLIKDGSIREDLLDINIDRFSPANLNIRTCTRRLACTGHDGPAFRQIDGRNLRSEEPEHQFLMGFRGIAGCLALCESVIDFVQDKQGQVGTNQFWNDRGKSAILEAMLETQKGTLENRTWDVRQEMSKWQELYLDRAQRGSSIVSCARTFEPKIRVACSSLYYGHRRQPMALTIVPSQDGKRATIVVSARRSTTWLDRVMRSTHQASELSEICDEIASMLENAPTHALIHLVQTTFHFVVNKRDYGNSTILTTEDRRIIAETAIRRWGAQL